MSAGAASDSYSWRLHGSRRHRNRNEDEVLPGDGILRVLEFGETGAFTAYASRGMRRQEISLTGPYPRTSWQHFVAGSQIPELHPGNWNPLIDRISGLGCLMMGTVLDREYSSWQRCDNPRLYAELFGSTDGFPLIRIAPNPPFPAEIRLDTSWNPGRVQIVNDGPARVAADMWLGPAFWTYAPCTKEEVLAQHWIEVRDTENYLYIKAYPEPFTRPDGEQGEIQRRLWQLLFHSDCRWPPSGSQFTDPAQIDHK